MALELAERVVAIEQLVERRMPDPLTERERQLVRAVVVALLVDADSTRAGQ